MKKVFQMILVLITAWLTSSCGDKNANPQNATTFTKYSDDGKYMIEGIEADLPASSKSQVYIFSDKVKPERVANQIVITSKGLCLNLPIKLCAKIAYPTTIRFHDANVKAGTGTIKLHGGDGAGGMVLELPVAKSTLIKAVAHTVASNTPEHHYP
jgi:hypothetical protein